MSIGYINGKYVALDEKAVPIEERGHQFGDGVYEVIRYYNGEGFMLEEHLERLEKSAEAIRIDLEGGIDSIRTIIEEGVKKAAIPDCSVYLQITRGAAERNHLFPKDVPPSVSMTIKPMAPFSNEMLNNGVSVITHPDERWANCYIKSLNLLPNILAKQAAAEKHAYEAILYKDGKVTECSSSTIFIVLNDTVITTPLSKQILPGITRMAVKEICEKAAIRFEEREYTTEELFIADEVFLTSTTSEVLPVTQIDDRKVAEGTPGNLTTLLMELFKAKTGQ
ncbi:D-amino-acid transaminase [Bacillus sp. H-16]|uniref:D-amino-acid transaminase n=1 Tax=Alteribacter salitolerans TaxID=2912333 RepID=UPI0019628E96|nr:D-amino-acid transaminase [Alteribacter salitolerans]MBM7096298.1 D-amino-acid transaminase [Alteribacter salitolerans]